MTFIPSKYQVNIFKEYVGSNNNIVINACPGSGKTRTILELLKLTPVYKKSIYLCYNKSIAEDLKKQAPKNIDISTVHSKGLSILYKTIKGKIKITDSKIIILHVLFLEINNSKIKKIRRDTSLQYVN